VPALALAIVVLVSVASAWSVVASQRALREANVDRFVGRADLHARFLGAYLAQRDEGPTVAGGEDTAGASPDEAVLDRFLSAAAPAPRTARLLFDEQDVIITEQGPIPEVLRDGLLAGTVPDQGLVGDGADEWFVVRREVPGTAWSLALSIPERDLFAGLHGWGRAAPWLVWTLLTLAGLVAATAIGGLDRRRGVLASQRVALTDANRQLERANVELGRSNAELEQFAYLASHDLQEPLRKVASYCQLVERRYRGQLDEDADEFLRYAVDGATRMQQLIADLLAYSRVGRVELDLRQVDLDELVAGVLDDLQLRVDETGARVDVAGPLPSVAGDAVLLRQLLQNLLDNALKFHGSDPPVVRVAASDGDGDRVHLVVADDGIGIPPEHTERVLGLFQRLHARHEFPGTGIGLAICHRIVERHGGTIRLQPRRPHGTEVHLELPRAPEVAP
jgi:signal transduction histidine kinase